MELVACEQHMFKIGGGLRSSLVVYYGQVWFSDEREAVVVRLSTHPFHLLLKIGETSEVGGIKLHK